MINTEFKNQRQLEINQEAARIKDKILSEFGHEDVSLKELLEKRSISLPNEDVSDYDSSIGCSRADYSRMSILHEIWNDRENPYKASSEAREELRKLLTINVKCWARHQEEYKKLTTLLNDPDVNYKTITELLTKINDRASRIEWYKKLNAGYMTLVGRKQVTNMEDLIVFKEKVTIEEERYSETDKKDKAEIFEGQTEDDFIFDPKEDEYGEKIYFYTWVDKKHLDKVLKVGLLPSMFSDFEDNESPFIYATTDANNTWASDSDGVSERENGCALVKVDATNLEFCQWYPYWGRMIVSSDVCGVNGNKKVYGKMYRISKELSKNEIPKDIPNHEKDDWKYSFTFGKFMNSGYFRGDSNESDEILLKYVPPSCIEVIVPPRIPIHPF